MGEYLTAEMVEHHGSMIIINFGDKEPDVLADKCELEFDHDDQARRFFEAIVTYLEMTDVYLQPDAIKDMMATLLGPEWPEWEEEWPKGEDR